MSNRLKNTERIVAAAIALGVGAVAVPRAVEAFKNPQAVMPTNEGVKDQGIKIEVKPVENSLISSKTGNLHKVSYKFNHPGDVGLGNMYYAEIEKSGQDITEAENNMATYLPSKSDREGKTIHPNEVVTVLTDNEGHVIPNPNPDNSVDK